ncbi:ribose 5-phosphate isomerase A [Limobrevibacterium gyesilva]|uniref:Ribose-5-phosphate isomerase A n=1 Tax=Limobrevibacterium gyesilva TaxID=2991712 RepID=A0AA41YQY2_9PROT|nr:ribose 5-phosphate isomerase A [Limobrevibacterium gyesilva]MCW3476947.1 ribose 5-phosphate isomerase A [Limobrevibacterium gyesilva]
MTEPAKRAAGRAAATLVQDGMLVGLGSGSTMRHAITALAHRVHSEGLRIVGIPTSTETEALALTHGITVAEPDATPVDLVMDGADEIETGTLRLVKGFGGALLREKIVAQSGRRFVVVADASKLVARLGQRGRLPVEVDRFGQAASARRIAELGGAPALRCDADGTPFETDGGHFILDCMGFGLIRDPFTLDRQLRAIAGVIETGLFLLPVEQVLIGTDDGTVRVLAR